jgi:hypothetical protein
LEEQKNRKLNKNKFIEILDKKHKIQQLETVELNVVVDKFPYFQSARSLYLKGLKNQDSFKYNNELKITAAFTTDRTVLFDFITSKDFNTQQEDQAETKEQISEITTLETSISKIVKKPTIEIQENLNKIETTLEIGKPIAFSTTENYSFNQWLQLGAKKPIIRTVKASIKTDKKEVIIETFIKNNPKIEPLPKGKDLSVTISKNKQDASLMTETLAKVYLEQKKYENAIQAYRILSLKYPEKSGFFADQIKRIQILQKHK